MPCSAVQWANWGIVDLINSPALEDASSLLGFNEPNHRHVLNLGMLALAKQLETWPSYALMLGQGTGKP